MALLLHYTGQDYISRGLLKTELTPGSTSAIVGGCKTGKGFAFTNNNASDAYTSMTTLNDNQLSISAWIRTNTNSTEGGRLPIFHTSNNAQNQILFGVYDVNKLRITVLFNDNTYYFCNSTENTILPNTWYFVTAQLNKVTRNMQLYINGVLINSTTYTNKPLQTTDRFFIGRRLGTFAPFRGHICNLKVYNHILSQKEINEDYKSLMLHYKLDKPITTQVFDHSGFNRHIQVIENTTTNSTTQKRVYGGSLANNGNQGLYGSLNLSELNGINEISVALRFRFIPQSGTHGYFSSRTTGGGAGINIFKLGGTSREFVIHIAGRKSFILPYDLVSGSWYDLVAVKSTTDVKLYINGTLINTIPNTNSVSNIGQLYAAISRSIADDNIENFVAANGNVQDIRFYAKALTQEDVTELYQTRQEIDNLANGYCYELAENIKYPSKYWHTPSYAEMYYILNTRANSSNLRTLGRVDINGNGTYVIGCFLLPDNWVLPADLSMTITTANFTTNSYSLSEFESLENAGAVFLPRYYTRVGSVVNGSSVTYWISSGSRWFQFYDGYIGVNSWGTALSQGCNVRLCKQGIQFSTSATTKIDFAPANLQYHCTQHIWRFAEHSYDRIGADNANISDSYNGWIDLFGYGTSGINYSPTLHSTNNADYASGDISNTDNDWGANEISEGQSEVEMKANGQLYCDEVIENDDGTFSINQNKTIKTKEIKEV